MTLYGKGKQILREKKNGKGSKKQKFHRTPSKERKNIIFCN